MLKEAILTCACIALRMHETSPPATELNFPRALSQRKLWASRRPVHRRGLSRCIYCVSYPHLSPEVPLASDTRIIGRLPGESRLLAECLLTCITVPGPPILLKGHVHAGLSMALQYMYVLGGGLFHMSEVPSEIC